MYICVSATNMFVAFTSNFIFLAMKFARNLVKMGPLQDWDFVVSDRLIPQCSKFGNWTTAYFECYLRHITLPGNAPVGTCKMGSIGDPTTVVDPQLRVRGLKGIRVADASIIPASMSGDTYATQVCFHNSPRHVHRVGEYSDSY